MGSRRINKLTVEKYCEGHSVEGAIIFMRCDFNVPLSKDGRRTITDATRIVKSVPCIQFLMDRGAKIVLVSHLGSPKGVDPTLTLDPVADVLSSMLGKPVKKLHSCVGPEVSNAVSEMVNGDVVLLENIRFEAGETKNKPELIDALMEAIHPDIFVNEAFGTAHRAHASTVGVAERCKVALAGMLLEKELRFLYGAIDEPRRPLVAVVGGAKVSSKIPVLESLVEKCDKILVGGGMMFTFLRAQGKEIGQSLFEFDQMPLSLELLEKAKARGVDFLLPVDTVVTNTLDSTSSLERSIATVSVDAIPKDCIGVDVGPRTVELFSAALADASTIVWNGPMGIFEMEEFAKGTMAIAHVLAERSEQGAVTIVGGGDSVSAVNASGFAMKISHISTGGGASLEVLEGKVLPGVAVLTDA